MLNVPRCRPSVIPQLAGEAKRNDNHVTILLHSVFGFGFITPNRSPDNEVNQAIRAWRSTQPNAYGGVSRETGVRGTGEFQKPLNWKMRSGWLNAGVPRSVDLAVTFRNKLEGSAPAANKESLP